VEIPPIHAGTFISCTRLVINSRSKLLPTPLHVCLTTPPLVHQCQKALNDFSTQHALGLYWVSGHAGVRGNEIADMLARDDSALNVFGPEPALRDSGQDIQRRIRRWLVHQHWVWWRVLGDTQRQAGELISGPCLGAKARFLSFKCVCLGDKDSKGEIS
jgi:hypothetical protein